MKVESTRRTHGSLNYNLRRRRAGRYGGAATRRGKDAIVVSIRAGTFEGQQLLALGQDPVVGTAEEKKGELENRFKVEDLKSLNRATNGCVRHRTSSSGAEEGTVVRLHPQDVRTGTRTQTEHAFDGACFREQRVRN
jgi:hypothetical protein